MSKDSLLPFEALDQEFRLLTTGPRPLSLDLEGIGGGLPPRIMPLDQLKNRLLHPSISHAARNEAVNRLVALAQIQGPDYVVGLAGVLLPGLKRAAAPLIEACPELLEDLQAEMLVGLLEAIGDVPPAAERVASRDLWGVSAGMANSFFVLLVIIAGAILMGHETVQTSYSVKDLAPRIVFGFIAANT